VVAADDLLEEMEAALARWDATRDSVTLLSVTNRILHTLKGGARMASQVRLGALGHALVQRRGDAQAQGGTSSPSRIMVVQRGYPALLGEVESMRQLLAVESAADADLDDGVDETPSFDQVPPDPTVIALDTPIVAASTQAPVVSTPAKVLPFVRRAEQAAQDAASRRAPQELVKVPADLLEGLVNLAGE